MVVPIIFFFSFILFPHLCGVDVRWHTPPCSTVVHIISRQSLLCDIILYFVQPSSLRSSYLPRLLYFHYHRPPPYVVFSLRITCPYHFNLLSCTFFVIPPTFVVHLILSFLFLSSLVTPHIHRSILISATSNLFSCAFVNAHVSVQYTNQCWSYHCSVHLPLDIHVHYPVAQHSRHYLPVLHHALHSVGDFRIQFSIIRHTSIPGM